VKDDDMFSGYLTTNNLQQGEYVLGVGKPFQSGTMQLQPQLQKNIEIYPNPSFGDFTIKLKNFNEDITAKLYTQNGALVDSFAITKKNIFNYRVPKKLKPGNYLIQFTDASAKIIDNEQLVIIKE
jgi:alpha-mannosidase